MPVCVGVIYMVLCDTDENSIVLQQRGIICFRDRTFSEFFIETQVLMNGIVKLISLFSCKGFLSFQFGLTCCCKTFEKCQKSIEFNLRLSGFRFPSFRSTSTHIGF